VTSGVVTSVSITAGGGAAGTISVYDGTSTSGILLVTLAGVPQGTSQFANIANGVAFATGLYVVVSGTASVGTVHYINA